MKKILSIALILVIALFLSGCSNKVTVIDFYGMDYNEALGWALENNVTLKPSSAYNDDVVPYAIFAQEIEAGTKIEEDTEIPITYSRGYDPKGVITLIDFSGMVESEIREWLSEVDINKFNIYETFSNDGVLGEFVSVEVVKKEERDDMLREDTYNFYFSKGSLEVEEVDLFKSGTIRGVNLGGWFVLEGWMAPDLFSGVNGSDETAFMQQKENASDAIINHYETFITEDDFIWLADHDVNYVRLPIPWWLFGVENAYAGTEYEVDYEASVNYIDQAMIWAEENNINVLLDLHTAPGCQNGFDNGGITGLIDWPKAENVALTLDIIEDITIHFSQYDSLWGIEVLNEPAWEVDITILKNYYLDAYDIIRTYNSDVYVGFHDGFRNYMTYSWIPFFEDNDFTNVFFDIHLYQVFGDGWADFDIVDHVNFVHNEQLNTIAQYDGVVPIVIGEWSLGLQGNVFEGLDYNSIMEVRTAFANAQLNVYETGMGHFFWSYKIDRDSHLEWDFRRLIEEGVLPSENYNN